MNMVQIGTLAVACIVSAGGIGGIVIAVIRFSSSIIADRLSSKYEYKLKKALEQQKTELSKKEFISKTRFETAFRMYQELCERNLTMVYCAGQAVVVLRGIACFKDEIEDFIEHFCNCLNDAELMTKRYAPFIDENLYKNYLLLHKESSEIFQLMKAWKQYHLGEEFCCRISDALYQDKSEVEQAITEKQKCLSDHSDSILKQLRDYLNTLEVIEE